MDAQKLTEEFKRPLTPEQTLPEQNSSEKPMEIKANHTQLKSECPLLASSIQARRGLVFEESDDFKQKALKWPNFPHYRKSKQIIL